MFVFFFQQLCRTYIVIVNSVNRYDFSTRLRHLFCSTGRENDFIAFAEYYNEPSGRSFGNCDIYNTTITWLHKHDHMARYFPNFLVFGTKFQYFDNGE